MCSKSWKWIGVVAVAALVTGTVRAKDEAMPAAGDAAIEAAAVQVSANVIAVDAAKRSVSLVGPLGRTNTYTLGKEVKNFDQIKVGDTVKATVLESVAVVIGKGMPASAGEDAMVAVAPKGAKPGIVMAKTITLTDKIDAVDAKAHTVSIEGVGRPPATFKVGPKIDLSKLKKGDDVVLRITEALAIVVEK